jgi:hypothetical protein
VSRIRIFKDVDGLNASEVAPEWYWNQATYLLMPNAPWYTVSRKEWFTSSQTDLIVKACKYLAFGGKTKNPATLAQKFHFLQWKDGKKVVASQGSHSPEYFLAPDPEYQPRVQESTSSRYWQGLDSPAWGRG